MIYQDLENSVVRNLNGRNDELALASIKSKTNLVIQLLASQKDWEDLQRVASANFVSGQYAYTFSELGITGQDKISSIKMYDSSRWQPNMKSITRERWNQEYASMADLTSGRPTVYCKFGGKLYFSRTPDSTYALEIDYYAQPTLVTGAASNLPYDNLDGLFEMLVTGLTWLSLGERELSSDWLKLAMPMIQTAGLDSGRMLGGHLPNRPARTGTDSWSDPFKRG